MKKTVIWINNIQILLPSSTGKNYFFSHFPGHLWLNSDDREYCLVMGLKTPSEFCPLSIWWYQYHQKINSNVTCIALCRVNGFSVRVQKRSLCSRGSSAARRCCDGAVEERKLTCWGMYGDGDWEIEDCATVANGWAACFRGTGWRGQDLRLKLEELSHEAEVGWDDAASLLNKLKGLVQLDAVGSHEIGKANGGRAGDASLTVYKHTASFIPHWI